MNKFILNILVVWKLDLFFRTLEFSRFCAPHLALFSSLFLLLLATQYFVGPTKDKKTKKNCKRVTKKPEKGQKNCKIVSKKQEKAKKMIKKLKKTRKRQKKTKQKKTQKSTTKSKNTAKFN